MERQQQPAAAGTEALPRQVPTARGEIECAEYGEGPAVLCLHGILGGFDQGLILARAAGGEGFRFVAISRPGYLGTALEAGRTPEEQADACAAALDALGIERAAVMAVSGGGPPALQFALRHPERCWGLVMISACSARLDVPLPLAWHLLRLGARIPWVAAKMREGAARDPAAGASRSIPDPEQRARTLGDPEVAPLFFALQSSTLDRLGERIRGGENDVRQTRKDLAFQLERMSSPLLVVHGTRDSIVPFEQSRSLSARVPGSQLLALDGGEHVSLFTHRDEVRARVTGFLREHAPQG